MNAPTTSKTAHKIHHDLAMAIERSATVGFVLPALSTYLTLSAANTLADFIANVTSKRTPALDPRQCADETNTDATQQPRNALSFLE